MNPDLLAWLAACNRDPEKFVLGAFPWSQAGTSLERATGPEAWQLGVLRDIKSGLPLQKAIQLATASGHGVGKSALVAWCILWAFTTSPDCRGVVTANTEAQLKTKTWAELGKWFNLFLGKEYFTLTATALLSRDPSRDRTWRIDMIPWSERNSEAFAGLHNQGKRIILIMDEASAILDRIWETAEGALTDSDTEIIWLAFGNPTRNTGRFKDCFPPGKFSRFWKSRQVDSREVSLTNKEQFTNWIEAYGEDSDFVRVRVKGTFPRHGEMEFISAQDVEEAAVREVTTDIRDPLALGVDVARYGSSESVLCFRKGRDARQIPWEYFRSLDTVSLALRIQDAHTQYSPDGIMVDGGGVGGGVVDNVRNLHLYCFDVQFGGKDDVGGAATGNAGELYANKRAAMWGAMRAWLRVGAIPNDPTLKAQLVGPTYTYNLRNEIVLESKEEMMRRGVESPDRADALALTFAYPLIAHALAGGDHPRPKLIQHEYDPFDAQHMAA